MPDWEFMIPCSLLHPMLPLFVQVCCFNKVSCSSVKKGKRSAIPHSRVMIHQPLGGAQVGSDIEITREILKLKDELYKTSQNPTKH